MIRFRHKGNFARTERFFHRARRASFFSSLEELAQAGVDALSRATPMDSGLTAQSWDYEIRNEQGKVSIFWKNSNQNQGVPIAVIIQYGHGTGNGGYVEGVDYINPALKPIFEQIAGKVWKEVTRA